MFCVDCGTQLPDEANFCWKCGKPQKTGIQQEDARWENCEIVYNQIYHLWYPEHQFWAEAIGTKGRYNAGESVKFSGSHWDAPAGNDKKAVAATEELISRLLKNGWESIPNGRYWYSYRFRRRVS